MGSGRRSNTKRCTLHQRQHPCGSRGSELGTLFTRARGAPCAYLLNHLVSTPIECRVTSMMRYSSSHDHNCRTQRKWFDVSVSRWYERQAQSSSGRSGTMATIDIATMTSASTSITAGTAERAEFCSRIDNRQEDGAGENGRSLVYSSLLRTCACSVKPTAVVIIVAS